MLLDFLVRVLIRIPPLVQRRYVVGCCAVKSEFRLGKRTPISVLVFPMSQQLSGVGFGLARPAPNICVEL